MNPMQVRALLHELMDENPFAIRAVLRILKVEFTEGVPTLAVTNEPQPRLLINLGFIAMNCRTEEHVKALLCHEFLHVLLRHTDERGAPTKARHLALDAVINAIIHRQLGERYSSLMSIYYSKGHGLMKLLRPMDGVEIVRYRSSRHSGNQPVPTWWHAWAGLYEGKVLADDLEQLARDFANSGNRADTADPDSVLELPDLDDLLGNHADDGPLSEALEQALERARKEMNGGGIWRNPGPGANRYELLVNPKHAALADWQARTLQVLRKHLEPAPGALSAPVPVSARLPVLSTSDRRAFLRATWSQFLPEAQWGATAQRPEGRAQVYLDVSGSMNAEMPLIVGLLGRLSRWIRRPFWAFSTEVVPAVIEGGVLKAGTSGGTSLTCVLEHVERTRPACAVIVTDGYVEQIPKQRLAALARHTRLHAIVTRDGNPAPLRNAGLAYSQLGRLPS
ncbi:MAG TPA: hypothetical protein VF851_06990 [Steroidobacteraceae bacterium]